MPAICCLLCGSLADVSVYKNLQELIAMTPRGKKKQGDTERKIRAHEDYLRSKFTRGELKDFQGYPERCTEA